MRALKNSLYMTPARQKKNAYSVFQTVGEVGELNKEYFVGLVKRFEKKHEKTNLINVFKILQETYFIKENLLLNMEKFIFDCQQSLSPTEIRLNENKYGNLIHEMSQGEYFGENFMGHSSRSASVICHKNTEFLVLSDPSYLKELIKYQQQEKVKKIRFFT